MYHGVITCYNDLDHQGIDAYVELDTRRLDALHVWLLEDLADLADEHHGVLHRHIIAENMDRDRDIRLRSTTVTNPDFIHLETSDDRPRVTVPKQLYLGLLTNDILDQPVFTEHVLCDNTDEHPDYHEFFDSEGGVTLITAPMNMNVVGTMKEPAPVTQSSSQLSLDAWTAGAVLAPLSR